MKHNQKSLTKTVIQSLHAAGAAKNRLAAPKKIANITCLTGTRPCSGRFFALPSGQANSLRSARVSAGQAQPACRQRQE